MGKVRNQRHRMNATGSALPQRAPERSLINLGGATVDLSGLESNLGSIEENKRYQACQLISDICRLNGHSSKVMDKVTNKKILAKFMMRLTDHSIRVKSAAASALQTMSSVGNVDVVGRLVASGIFRAALVISTEIVDLSVPDFVDIKQNLLYTVANILSSQPASIQEIINHKADFFEFLISNLFVGNNIGLLNTCLNVLTILSRSSFNGQLAFHLLEKGTISAVQQLMNAMLEGKFSMDPNTSTVILNVTSISISDQDSWIVIIQCLEVLSNLYVNSATPADFVSQIDIRNTINVAVQFLGLAAEGISVLDNESHIPSRENDLIEMLSEFFSNLCTKLSSYIQGLEDDNGHLRQPSDNQLFCRLTFVGSIITSTRTPRYDSISALTSVWQQLQNKVRSQMMSAEDFANLRDQNRGGDIADGDDEVMVSDDLDPNVAVTNPSTAAAPGRTMPSNLMGARWVLSHDAVGTMQVFEKAQSALGDMLVLQSSLIAVSSITPMLPVSPVIPWESFFAHATFLQEALDNTTPSMDASSRKAIEGWMTAEEEDLLPLKSSIISQCVAYFDVLTVLISHSAQALPASGCIWLISEEQLRSCAILLVQWLSAPQLEVCVAVLATVASVSKEQWCGSNAFPVALLGVLTNALINRLRQPTAFSSSSSREGNDGSTTVTLNKNQNVQRASILLMDAIFNSLIDLHSSDHLSYHDLYQRLNLSTALGQQRDQLVQKVQSNIFLLNESEREQIEDTLTNIDGLLEYKRTNFR